MPRRIAANTLNGSTIKILNTIRANAALEYQQSVPVVEKTTDIPKVGEFILGNPSISNQFLNALINRIALVRVQSSIFNNPYAPLKKGYIGFGETVEEVFAEIVRVRTFDVEKAPSREFARTLPDVKTAFHAINWNVQYPLTIEQNTLRQAFTSAEGVTSFIESLISRINQAAEYDEFLLFKYLIIKGLSKGQFKPVNIGAASDFQKAVVQARSLSNLLTFRKRDYNARGVLTVTPRNDQFIFLDTEYEAEQDVNVLASAFNMDRTTFLGQRRLIDHFYEFDNERFNEIRRQSDQIEEVTEEELELAKDVKFILLDKEWFQVYDVTTQFSDTQVASGLYWNYFLNIQKIVSTSPFANALAFVATSTAPTLPDTLTASVTQALRAKEHSVVIVELDEIQTLATTSHNFIQTLDATQKQIAVKDYGLYTFSRSGGTTIPEITVSGVKYIAGAGISPTTAVGTTVTFTKEGVEPEPDPDTGGGGSGGGSGS